ncbi:unnamed protein product [Cylicostephanus goldi]|uniref:Choline/carnitine acyltransferase domain-containing protein n=1 Tax=Cylicostephanus goldi TaxID=71465 RepID=A0A3P7MHH6_CYLGO|nr:unnamed protein product [Cylicostephanus goldi]
MPTHEAEVTSIRCLPKPPVPTLDHTLERYREYAEVVAEGMQRDIQGTLNAVDEFRKIGTIYQQRLEKIAEGEPNWVSPVKTVILSTRFRKQLEREVSTGKVKVKMCMQQYDRILSCYRRPSIEEDIQIVKEKRNNGNEHILVMSRDQVAVVTDLYRNRY